VTLGDDLVVFESVNAASQGVALFVDLRVESGWSATGRSFVVAMGVLIGFGGDGGTPTQVPVRLGRVRLVCQHPVGLVRGRPPAAEAPIRSNTAASNRLSPRCPALSSDNGFDPARSEMHLGGPRPQERPNT